MFKFGTAMRRVGGLSPGRLPNVLSQICENRHNGGLERFEANLHALPPDELVFERAELRIEHLLAPVAARSFRDFYAFEEHVRNARKKRGLDMVPEWYEEPVFYFSNTASIVGPNAEIKKPVETNELDYELELAVVIGREGSDIPVAEADDYIAGFTILNDWSAPRYSAARDESRARPRQRQGFRDQHRAVFSDAR